MFVYRIINAYHQYKLNKNLIHGKNVRLAALEISKKIIIAQEDTFVNKNKVATQFVCQEIGTI
jgi:hypothetical protein